MKRFDPTLFLPLPEHISSVPVHGVSWSKKFANWWAGATIASPTTTVAAPASTSIEVVRRFLSESNLDDLNYYYTDQTQYLRWWVRRLLSLPESAPVILEASGTAAILLATRMFAHLGRHPEARLTAEGRDQHIFSITTSEEGSLVGYALKGEDPNAVENVMFFPTSRLFFQAGPAMPYPQRASLTSKIVDIASVDNVALLDALRAAVLAQPKDGSHGCIVVPTVTKTGRILPVRAIGALVDELRLEGYNLFYLVDDVQGMGRMDMQTMTAPLSYCDAYVFSAAKALGGILTASVIAMREEHVEAFVKIAQSQPDLRLPCLARFQLEPRFEERLPEWMFRESAVAIPEVVAMHVAMMSFYHRGKGENIQERRDNQLAIVRKKREQVLRALADVPSLRVLSEAENVPLVPSIISFQVDLPGVTPAKLKRILQDGNPVITPTAPVGRYLRLDIPEYREMPSVNLLAERMTRAIRQLCDR